ncbi:ninja-family protein AFP3-like [Mangifera indica]|uniref:ninja-family protein AFP3-like n=1 Tax=Mangifera indica TaxID=29780 RepID=UPI001CFB33BF|nr:ninja-family protein AFP3-like [Mangifera indica]
MAKEAQESGFSRDLSQRFMNGTNQFVYRNLQQGGDGVGEETEEIELSLGLSLNGRFGVEPERANKLKKSSSIPDFLNPIWKDYNNCNNSESSFIFPMGSGNLTRTCSLPTETEEDWRRKRKELQTLRRMEAKRKRSEKQRNWKISRDRSRAFGEEEDNRLNGVFQAENFVQSLVNDGKGAHSNSVIKGGGGEGSLLLPPAAPPPQQPPPPPQLSQGSIGSSQASGSSGISEFESQPFQGLSKCTEAISPSIVQSMRKNEHKSPINPEATTAEKPGKFARVSTMNELTKTTATQNGVKEVVRNVLEDMPCVSTTGDGPNGRRIEGFLYQYRKGEEVRIVCVCHGSFLTPAEFVKHAGGGDVAHPLRHIIVNPSALL